jgi:AraC-like DNA-binding protein
MTVPQATSGPLLRWTETGTASVVALGPLVAFSRTQGIDIDFILAGVGLSRGELEDYDRRIPERSRAQVWVEAAARAGDPDFGLEVAEHAPRGSYDVLEYALRFSATVLDAAACAMRFHRVLCDAWAIALEPAGDEIAVRLVEITPPPATEELAARIVLTVRQVTGVDVTPVEVRFRHGAPSRIEHHARLFRCALRFDQPTTAVVFRRGDLERPCLEADAGVERILVRYLGEILGRLPRNRSFAERARAAVAATLPSGRPTLRAVARELRSSPRTVQRRLREHGTTHRELVDSVRRELAERLVAEGRLSITEIAFLLGFADVSGFRRRFERWTGGPPSRGRSG